MKAEYKFHNIKEFCKTLINFKNRVMLEQDAASCSKIRILVYNSEDMLFDISEFYIFPTSGQSFIKTGLGVASHIVRIHEYYCDGSYKFIFEKV